MGDNRIAGDGTGDMDGSADGAVPSVEAEIDRYARFALRDSTTSLGFGEVHRSIRKPDVYHRVVTEVAV